jgi:hypothetical protein
MDLITRASEVIEKANEKWDELPVTAKTAVTGSALLLGLLIHKLVLGLGVIAFFGQRIMYHLGVTKQVLEGENKEDQSEEADKSPA